MPVSPPPIKSAGSHPPPARESDLPYLLRRLAELAADEEGATQAFEVALIVGVVLPPLLTAIFLMQRLLREYMEVTDILVTSPFF